MTKDNILIIKLGALGDVIQSFGPMRAIRAHHPNARITVLTTKAFESLIRASGYADDIWIDSRPKWHDIKGWLELRARFNNANFTRVYDLQNNDRTAFYLQLFSPRPEWSGAARGASHRNDSPERTQGKAYDGHVQTLRLAGVAGVQPDRLEWMTGDHDFIGLQTPYVLIVPGSSPKHPHKRWPAQSYAAFAHELIKRGYQPVIIGTKEERDIAQIICDDAKGAVNLAGETSLFDIPDLARGAFAAIGNDTGPMHLIAPTGCASFVLFSGKTDPKRHAPMGRNVITLQKENLDDLTPTRVWTVFASQSSFE